MSGIAILSIRGLSIQGMRLVRWCKCRLGLLIVRVLINSIALSVFGKI